MVMENMSKEDLNSDLYATIKETLLGVSNLRITFAAFGDRSTFDGEKLISTSEIAKDLNLVNYIDSNIIKYFDDNIDEIDFSSHNTSFTSLNSLSNDIYQSAIENKINELGSIGKGSKRPLTFKVIQMLAARKAAIVAFEKAHYYTAMEFYKNLIEMLNVTVSVNIYDRSSKSLKGKEKAKTRWSKHNQTRPEKKKQYLQIMDQQNFTTFAETAEYIKQHIETDKKPSYDTIKRWLSQASKGDFS